MTRKSIITILSILLTNSNQVMGSKKSLFRRKLPKNKEQGLIAQIPKTNIFGYDKTGVFYADQAAINALNVLNNAFLSFSSSDDQHFKTHSMTIDILSNVHVRFERYYQNLKIFGGDVIVHLDSSYTFMNKMTSSFPKRNIQLSDITPAYTPIEAYFAVKNEFGGLPSTEYSPELLLYARRETTLPILAYLVRLQGACLDGTPSDYYVIVDAKTLGVLESWNNVQTLLPSCLEDTMIIPTETFSSFETKDHFDNVAPSNATGLSYHGGEVTFTTNYNPEGDYYEMMDVTRGGSYVIDMKSDASVMKDEDNTWGFDDDSYFSQSVGVDVQYGIQTSLDFLTSVLGRNGVADDGKGILSRVHYGNRYSNAFFSSLCNCLTFGDGDGEFLHPLTALDIVGHELAHSITHKTASLIYNRESGALNEATSDIIGSMIEFAAKNYENDSPDYLIGEKMFKKQGAHLRSMMQPSMDGVSADCYFEAIGDLNVHYSSGVANHFFFLLAEGTKVGIPSKTCALGDTMIATASGTIVGIGKNKAMQIWYLALSAYMTSSTTFKMARSATIQASEDLFGDSVIEEIKGEEIEQGSAGITQTVKDTWDAVGVYDD